MRCWDFFKNIVRKKQSKNFPNLLADKFSSHAKEKQNYWMKNSLFLATSLSLEKVISYPPTSKFSRLKIFQQMSHNSPANPCRSRKPLDHYYLRAARLKRVTAKE